MRALFLPKILANEAGNGLHLHLSFSKTDNDNAFVHSGSISKEGQSFMVSLSKLHFI